MKRSKNLQNFIDDFAKVSFGHTQTDAINQSVCVMCGRSVILFRDTLSKKEYSISGMCQKCQDEIFGR